MNALRLEPSKHSLATQVLQSWGKLKLRVSGASMIPTLWPGDLLTLQAHDFDRIQPGNLVLYAREGRFIVHRAVRKSVTAEGGFLITRGDCVAKEDAPVAASAVLGKVTQIQRRGLLLEPGRQFMLGRRILASLLCRWDRVRNVILWLRIHSAEASPDFAMMQSAP
jgi:signal peptidase I